MQALGFILIEITVFVFGLLVLIGVFTSDIERMDQKVKRQFYILLIFLSFMLSVATSFILL